MGGYHNLQDLVKEANKEIQQLNEVLDSFPIENDSQVELLEGEIHQ